MRTPAGTASPNWSEPRKPPKLSRRAGRESAGLKDGVGGHSIATDNAVSCSSRSGTGRLLDPDPEPGQRPRESRLHSAFRDAQGGRRLLAAQLQKVATRDDQAVLFAQRVDHREQAAALVRPDGDRLRGWGRIPPAEALGQSN